MLNQTQSYSRNRGGEIVFADRVEQDERLNELDGQIESVIDDIRYEKSVWQQMSRTAQEDHAAMWGNPVTDLELQLKELRQERDEVECADVAPVASALGTVALLLFGVFFGLCWLLNDAELLWRS